MVFEISVKTSRKVEFIDITQSVVERVEVENGICVVYCPHTTAALTINEGADQDVKEDILSFLNTLVPDDGQYRHSEGNSPGHIKASIMGSSLNIMVEDGSLLLGTWQSIYLCEFDGPRTRKVFVKQIKA